VPTASGGSQVVLDHVPGAKRCWTVLVSFVLLHKKRMLKVHSRLAFKT